LFTNFTDHEHSTEKSPIPLFKSAVIDEFQRFLIFRSEGPGPKIAVKCCVSCIMSLLLS
jgi:hypothetical protein